MIQALALWVNVSLRIRRVKFEAEFDETEFTTILMTNMVDEDYVHYLDCKTNSYVITTGKFSYNKWGILEETVINWLQAKRGFTNLPLSYVIRKDNNPLTMYQSELIIYNDSLTTAVLKSDIRKVANILTHIVLDNDAFEWGGRKFTQSKGREGWLDLMSHYNGSAEPERLIYAARQNLSNLFYKNEMAFNFETFSTNLKATFNTMEKYGEGGSDQEKVSTLLEKICTKNQNL